MQSNQSNQIESMTFQIETLPPIQESMLGGYRMYRSPVQTKFVNVVAVDKYDNMLAVVASDMLISDAQELVQLLNKEFEQLQESF